jgi:RNA polymerase sigma factor (sigma-70 family)
VKRLLRRAKSGDREAAGELARIVELRARANIRRRLGPELRLRVDTDDILQSTYATFIEKLGQIDYRGEAALLRWLTTAIERQILDASRFHRAHKRDLRRERPLERAGELPADLSPPADAAAMQEELQKVRAAVDGLPDLDSRLFRLRAYDGRTFREIAEILGLPDRFAAHSLYTRALRKVGWQLRRPSG